MSEDKDKDLPFKVTLTSYNDPATIRVIESVERFQLDNYKVEVVSNTKDEENECSIIVIEGSKQSLLKLAKYIEAVERLAKDWIIPVIPE